MTRQLVTPNHIVIRLIALFFAFGPMPSLRRAMRWGAASENSPKR